MTAYNHRMVAPNFSELAIESLSNTEVNIFHRWDVILTVYLWSFRFLNI